VDAGIAVRDVTPPLPIRLAGYAARSRPADKVDHPLLVQALALRNPSGERFVLVALDNCEVSREFMRPVLERLQNIHGLAPGAVAVVSSHTHSGPVLTESLVGMPQPPPGSEWEKAQEYSRTLREKLVEVVSAALQNFAPARLEYGEGRAGFAMNRRVYQGDKVVFGDNPDGPVDPAVPVLRIRDSQGAVRCILFGYACHGTSVRSGDDWYTVSGEYMAYARDLIEKHEPGAVAMYLTGMGADSDPAPRGRLLHARRHGVELAGAVMGVIDRPMRPVAGPFRMAYEELDLPLAEPPTKEQIMQECSSTNAPVRQRASVALKTLSEGRPLTRAVRLPVCVVRFGNDLTWVLMGGEVVVDYSLKLKRVLAEARPWTIGYAYEVPCYIPSARLVKEGGYETEASLMYYGLYGPFQGAIEEILVRRVTEMSSRLGE
jgi:hypothetical protein